jgi:hypothetical protein
MTTENYSKSMSILKTFSKLRWWLAKNSCPAVQMLAWSSLQMAGWLGSWAARWPGGRVARLLDGQVAWMPSGLVTRWSGEWLADLMVR